MRDYFASSVIFALYSLEAQAAPRGIPGRSLEDCEAFAALFDNTCQDGAFIDDFANHAGAEVSCAGNMACPSNDSATSVSKEDYTTESPCTFTRKLCVSCSQASDDADVYISV